MMAMIRADLAALNIKHEVFFSERSLVHGEVDQVAATIEALARARAMFMKAACRRRRVRPVEDWEDREQTLFRSTAFGDDVDRPLKKSDGSYTYFASDIAYHADKIRRGFRTLIDVWGADHGGYIKRMKAAVAALSDGKAELDVKLVQLVKLLRAGEPVKMSKRAGEFVTLRDVVDEVGRGRGPLHDAVPEERCGARLRLGEGAGAIARQSGVLRPIRPRARAFGVSQCARSLFRPAAAAGYG